MNNYFYYITIAAQIICVIHCVKRGNPNYWILLIIFVPLLGCLAYFFTQIADKGEIQKISSGVNTVINSAGSIKKLEKQLEFADTFQNRITLADAYLASGETNKAISIYEKSLAGAFTENEHVLMQLIIAYASVHRYDDVVRIAKKIYNLPQFSRSHAHMLYAIALEKTGNSELAEKEFTTMKGKFAFFESRYQYGLFLLRANRAE
ncbi:MAG: hypothetical protein ABI921_09860, partial [Panacibacter sp.]